MRIHLPLLVLSLAACAVPVQGPAAAPVPATTAEGARRSAASAELERLFADEWEWRLRENPLLATSVGDRRFNDRLPQVGLADQARRLEESRAFLARLRAIPRDSLTAAERINYDIFAFNRRSDIEETELLDHLIPITNREGFHTAFPELPERVPLRTVEDYRSYIARLRGFRAYAAQHAELMREGARRGFVLPRISLEGIEETLQPHAVTDPTKSLLWKPFARFPASVPESERAALAAAGREAILEGVVPGYREFLDFITREYRPAARPTLGASELPGGRAYYAQRVRMYTTLHDATPEQVHQTGLAEVARIRAEMEQVMRSTGFSGGFPEFVHFLRTDARFYPKTEEELMERNAVFLKRMDGELPKLFGRLPRMPYGIKPIPEYIAPRTTTAYYSQPAGDGTRAGFYWINTYNLGSRPLYEIEALASHEAVPGHHLQLALQQELQDLPNFRRYGGVTAFVEGWALYSEVLGKELGFYTDPYSDFGRLSYEMWRALRLVVDTGIHWKGWTRQQAIDYMAANSALTLVNITNEVDRYIAWPGQALAYKTGQMKIRDLRREAERELGGRFDVRKFHDVVLGSGSIPLTVLESNVRAWVAAEKARP
ncbi:MAG: DUF885 domain-containing protein [Gemmatimonadota bacterium]|nr:DUF885 domain-containing protein [Gemmatimonadota bacterium]